MKPIIKILGKGPLEKPGEPESSPKKAPLLTIKGTERLSMPPPGEAMAGTGKSSDRKSNPTSAGTRAGLTIEISTRPADGIYDVVATSQFRPNEKVSGKFAIPFSMEYLRKTMSVLTQSIDTRRGPSIDLPGETSREGGQEGKISIENFGANIFNALFKDEIKEMYQEACDVATSQFPISIVTSANDVCQFPWELLYDGDGERFLCTGVGPIFRVLPNAPPAAPDMQISDPLRLLVAFTNAPGTPVIDGEEEEESIRKQLMGSSIEVRVPRTQKIGDFTRALVEWKPHIIHVIAHGKDNQLQFAAGAGKTVQIGNVLGQLVGAQPGGPPRLVILNACETAGLAASMLASRVPMAVGMQFSISDVAGMAFAKGFYEYVRFDKHLHKANAWARLQISALLGEDTREWAAPVLYVNPRKVDLS